ncbi:MAG: lysophospholipid acyltransferase family protein, partial [Acidimicrobiales bacterium]
MTPPLPGGEPPKRRLPVTPGSVQSAVGAARRQVRRRRSGAFPWSAPHWPGGVARPLPERVLGVDYDTEWARRYPARVARLVLTDFVARPLITAVATPRVEGLDRIAHLDEPVIFAANHASHLDGPLLISQIPERWRHRIVVAGAADYFFDTRLKATALALAMNAVPIERLKVSRRSANLATVLLGEGWSLLIFPEGGRSPDGWGQTHRPGAGWLAQRSGRAIVPVHLAGTRQVLPRHSRRIRPGRTTVSFGRPLRPEAGGDPRLLAARVEAAIAALGDEERSDWWTATR